MIRLAKKTRPECEERLAKFLAMDHPCQRPLPHRSLAKRTPEQMMSIPFKPGFEHVVPPPVRYKTPVHLQPVLKKCLIELINLGVFPLLQSLYVYCEASPGERAYVNYLRPKPA